MTHSDDDELQSAFEQLRDDDRARTPAPEFRAVWTYAESRARAIRRPRTMTPLWIAAAAGVVLALGLAFRGSRQPDATLDTGGATLSTWTSPTASLLNISGRALLAPPPILSSILDGAAPAPVPRKGD
jgi:hypothetical protein